MGDDPSQEKFPWSWLRSIEKRLLGYGIQKRDIPEAVLLMNLGFYSIYPGIFFVCSKVRPLRRLASHPVGISVRREAKIQCGERYERLEQYFLSKAEQFGNLRFIKPLPRMLGQSAKEFSLTLAETMAVYNITFPFWVWIIIIGIKKRFQLKHAHDHDL
ncbi:hypothetical protein AAMO2058_000244900 [Amorphochlora amoebiformis]